MTSPRPFPPPVPVGPVRLRALREADLPDFLAYRSDLEVARFQGWSPLGLRAGLRIPLPNALSATAPPTVLELQAVRHSVFSSRDNA